LSSSECSATTESRSFSLGFPSVRSITPSRKLCSEKIQLSAIRFGTAGRIWFAFIASESEWWRSAAMRGAALVTQSVAR
jgi:hypothetical protein